MPAGLPDQWGGVTIEVDQFQWGHKARKRTLLYIVGMKKLPLFPLRTGRNPTHVIDGNGAKRKLDRQRGVVPLPAVSHKEREATPVDFAKWLVDLALQCSI